MTEMPQHPATPNPQQPQAQPAQVLPTQAGYVPKAGAAVFVANSVLDGWLKGRQVRAENQLRKAQTQVQGADYAYKALSDNYNNLLRSGKGETDPEVQKAKQAAVAAWQAKLNVMQQYAMPQEPQKKTAKKGSKRE